MSKTNIKKLIKELVDAFEPIESEVTRMMGNRGVFQVVVEISKKNPQINKGNSFWDLFKESYVALMVSTVCRQVDSDPRSASLINLLNKLLQADITTAFTKDWYSGTYHRDNDILPGFSEGMGRSDFETHFGSKDFVDPDIIRADLNKLIADTKEIKQFRNKRIAHRDTNNKLVFDVNFNDLDKAIETIREITSKYYLLVKQGGNDLVPPDQTDWQGIFTVPWIKREHEDD